MSHIYNVYLVKTIARGKTDVVWMWEFLRQTLHFYDTSECVMYQSFDVSVGRDD